MKARDRNSMKARDRNSMKARDRNSMKNPDRSSILRMNQNNTLKFNENNTRQLKEAYRSATTNSSCFASAFIPTENSVYQLTAGVSTRMRSLSTSTARILN